MRFFQQKNRYIPTGTIKQSLVSLLLLFIVVQARAQRGYYVLHDTALYGGVKLVDGDWSRNAQYCQIKKGDSVLLLTPDVVTEYGFDDGSNRAYVSHKILLEGAYRQVFLYRLEKGIVSLYYFKSGKKEMFFLEEDQKLRELPKNDSMGINYRQQLKELTMDYPPAAMATSLLAYRRENMANFLNRYIKHKLYPKLRYGVVAGIELKQLMNTADNEVAELNDMEFDFATGFKAGAFIDYPIALGASSVYAELYYARHVFSCHSDKIYHLDFLARTQSLNLPIMWRINSVKQGLAPFVSCGGMITYNFDRSSELLRVRFSEDVIEIMSVNESSLIPAISYGAVVSSGIEFRGTRYRMGLSARYGLQYSADANKLGSSTLSFNLTIGL